MTAPLTPAACDLTDFPFMPLDVARLRDSELASNETPEACWAAVLLWAASWHQIPAASIPNDEKWIAKQAGYAQRGKVDKAWADVRDGALRGFVVCDDGRLYHAVVAEKACEAWKSKLAHRWRTECARIKKHNERHHTAIEKPEFDAWMSAGCPQGQPLFVPSDNGSSPDKVSDETASKGQGERKGQGQGKGDLDSEAIASAAAAAPGAVDKSNDSPPAKPEKTPEEMAKAELWRAAVSVLEHGGCPPSQCRTFMGKLVQDYGFEIVKQAVAAAVSEQPADAREYLKATCMRRNNERKDPVTVASDAAEKTRDANARDDAHLAAQDPEARRALIAANREAAERLKAAAAGAAA